MEIAGELQDTRMLSYAYGYLGQLYEQEKQYAQAIRLTRSAIFSAQQGYHPELSYLWQWQSGRIFKAEDDIGNAVKSYENAVAILTPRRERCEECETPEDAEKAHPPGILHELFKGYRGRKLRFSENVKPVYLELAELLLKQERLSEAWDTMEHLKTAELQDFFQDECVTEKQKNIRKLEKMPPRTAMLYPIPFQHSLTLLLASDEDMRHFDVPVDSESLGETADEFRKELENVGSDRYRHYAEKLHTWLIKPVEEYLVDRNIDTLIIAPDGPLRLIPFSALHDGEHFLIEKYALVTVPAITLTDLGKPGEGEKADSLLCGLSQGDPPLPHVRKELDAVRAVTHGKILSDEAFTMENLTHEFKNQAYANILMATHGKFGGTVQETFLQLYDDILTMDKLEEFISFGRFRDQQTELLTLSACQTALSDERAALGLAGIAVKAGVRSAVATLWSVSDEAASLTVTEFYREIGTGISKAKALQQAQRKLIISHSRFQHPSYWAPFLLIGNWR